MNDSESRRRHATQIIERITALLDETHLIRIIDEPIDAAAETHQCHVEVPESHRQFHDLISEFVFHVYKHAQACPRQLTRSQSRDEAVALLEPAYAGTHTNGYHAALLDATDTSQGGMGIVLSRLADIIKSGLRQDYRGWVFAHFIDPADRRVKCDVAALLLEQCSPRSAVQRVSFYPEQFVDHIPELLDTVLIAQQFEQQASAPRFPAVA